MNKEFIHYEQALELKELGFNEKCFGYFGVENELMVSVSWNSDFNLQRRNFISAPLYQQAFRWFREKYELLADITIDSNRRNDVEKWMYSIVYLNKNTYSHSEKTYNTYEEAELACLKKLIEIVKNK